MLCGKQLCICLSALFQQLLHLCLEEQSTQLQRGGGESSHGGGGGEAAITLLLKRGIAHKGREGLCRRDFPSPLGWEQPFVPQ